MKIRDAVEKTVKLNLRATSLVEVLVVLVILLIGVFAIIQVFPLGFTLLRNSESRMNSTRLAHGLMEKVQSDSANLPNAVTYSYFSWNGSRFVRQFVMDQDPDDLSTDPSNPYYNDLNKFRLVVGEPVKIGLPTPTASGNSGSAYMAKLGPIYMDELVGNPNAAPTTQVDRDYFNLFLAVNSAPLNVSNGNYRVDPNFYRTRLSGPQNCLVDENEDENGGAWILFYPAATDRVFTVRFTRLKNDHDDTTNDQAYAVTDKVYVPANFYGWKQLCDPADTDYAPTDDKTFNPDDAILPGSEVVTREFTRLAAGASWTADNPATPTIDESDPYEYKLISPNLTRASGATADKPYANPGILLFNPQGARFGNGKDPFKAYIDYAVLDWHIIHDDRDVPIVAAGSDGEVPVRTTLTRLKSLDYVNPDNTFYEGIFPPGDTDINANTDIMIIRLDTGGILNSGQSGRPGDYGLLKAGTAGQAALDYWVNSDPKTGSYANGVLYINSNTVAPGTPIRILYKAQGDWGVALTKAISTYRETSGGWVGTWANVSLDPSDPAEDRYVDTSMPDKFWRDTTAGGIASLYFARTELNKSMVVTLMARSSASAPWRRMQPKQLTIDTPNQVTVGGNNNVNVAYVDVTKYLRQLGWDGAGDNWRVVGDIKGATAKSRVIWKDSLERKSPWRIQDLDTYLTQSILK
ncbi:MAG: hypothetical protein NTX57_20805 [Armatimonadetes bacterium]|nr:hypothetical protein [Armatimonadota bacterium]